MPQFIFIELPTFRIRDKSGNSVALSNRHLSRVICLLQYVRSGLRTSGDYHVDLCTSLLFSNGETDLWTAANTTPQGHHAEENLLLAYFQSFDSPGAYPLVDAILLSSKPCGSCMDYFSLNGKHLRPLDDGTGTGTMTAERPFRAKFTPRSDKTYTPVFYLSRSLSATQRENLWLQLRQMWTGELGTMGVALAYSPAMQMGEMYYLFGDESAPWYALNGQENMSDTEIAEAISRQELSPAYWIGR
ncbi:hypothetical protein EKO27_g8619 [Xylaria grammica]|uniref:Uncharacterized protein n=1 Tax=Xylaria grammica TaxID=363999 RepID=A0A439CWF5_9PEZI|nr:hypothetical protein EKO27_g8619 [Xylaria grammica]